jgi:phage tail sheath protein FI
MAEKILSPGVFQNESDQSLVQRGIQGTSTAVVGPTVLGQPLVPTYVTSYSEFVSKFGETFKSGSYYYEYLTSLAAKDYFNNGGQTLLVTKIISGSGNVSTYASSTVTAFTNSGPLTSSFTLETIAWGDVMNNTSSLSAGALASGSAINVRWEVTNVNTGSGVFSLAVRAGNDNNAQPNYLETWPNLSLDPALPNFISRVIGDIKPIYRVDTDGAPYIDTTGSYANASQYVRVRSITTPQVDSIDNNGAFKATQYSGSLPAVGSGSYGGSFSGSVAATNAAQLMNEYITATNVQGFGVADYQAAFNLLANKDEYQFNVLLAPGVTLDNAASATMISTCESRGDAIAVVDCKLYGNVVTAAATAAAGQSSNYAATYWPWVQLFSSALGKAVWAPASTVMGGVFAFNDQVGAEWFAPAGLNRGGVPSVLKAERKLTQNDRDVLYQANVNPLATFPGEGVVVFGQKTLQRRATALDRVNVRRLLIALKGYIGQVANNLVFEQNTNVTRNRFLSQVNPYLESVVQRQGLYAYKVVMDDTNNTPDVIDRNQLVGQIYIQPTKTAEFIILNFNVLPTGATFPA